MTNTRSSTKRFLAGVLICGLWQAQVTQAAEPDTAVTATVENSGAHCLATSFVPYAELPVIDALPNPFAHMDGSEDDSTAWTCRRADISAQLQHWIYGEKPAPTARVSATGDGQSLHVTVTDQSQSQNQSKGIDFTATVTLPSTGQPPYPAIIAIGRSFLDNNALLKQGVAIIDFPNNLIGDQSNASARGKGKFYDLYGTDHSAASTVAWAWGVSRLIDALETTENLAIDSTRLGVTGCSRNGKGALVTGALDERIALTIVQESGSGGSASWRVSEAMKTAGQNVQTASQIVTENTWLRENFAQFADSVNRLPVDNHQLLGLVAPRGLLLLENTDMEWLGNKSAYLSALAAREIYRALGAPDHMGITQIGGHQHCVLPAAQAPAVEAFVQKFLLGDQMVNTGLVETDGDYKEEKARWMPWAL